MTDIPRIPLNDGHTLPAIALGTYGLWGPEGVAAVSSAIAEGYRLLDTALNYKNESEVGEAVRASGIDRSELLVTSKLPGRHHGYDEAIGSLDETLSNLGLDTLDLYLIHWPLPKVGRFVDAWRAMIDMRDEGRVRSIGVSNFTADHIKRLQDATGVTPAVNQVELHPYFPQAALRAFHREQGIATESWSPLAKGSDLLAEPVITAIAAAHGRTPAQVVVRWHTQLGAIPVPKSGDPQRQRRNLDVFDFVLSDDDLSRIGGLESGRLWDGDPDTHEEF